MLETLNQNKKIEANVLVNKCHTFEIELELRSQKYSYSKTRENNFLFILLIEITFCSFCIYE